MVENWGVLKIIEQPVVEEKSTEAPKLKFWKGERGECYLCGWVKYYCPHFSKLKQTYNV